MTERWRKKLRDLDVVGPSDDVYRRAREIPAGPGEPFPDRRASNRVVTGVVAFSVFALALSVFAVPFLRMGGTGPADEGSLGIFPIWPAQTSDQLKQLQADPPAWAMEPRTTATAFVERVMGWTGATARLMDTPGCVFGTSGTPTPMPGNQGGCLSPSAAPDGLLTFAVSPAEGKCNVAGCPAPLPEIVEVYQPLAQGEGQIWAVHQALASAPRLNLSVVADQHVRDGATIDGTASPSGYTAFLATGYGSCGQYASTLSAPDAQGSPSAFEIDVQLKATPACQGLQPGYAWAAAASVPISQHSDPILHRTTDDPIVSALTAVPVVMILPTIASSTTPSSAEVSGSIEWRPYTDPFGWTVDVPSEWTTETWPDAGAGFSGDGLTVEITRGGAPLSHDDSSLPLDPKGFLFRGEGGLIGKFYGDGLPFGFVVIGDVTTPPDLGVDQRMIVDHMIESITFEPWKVGETRNGLTAIGKVHDASSAEWIGDWRGVEYLASFVDGHRQAFGPSPGCLVGSGTYEVRETGVAGVTCSDGTGGFWDFATGKAQPGNTANYSAALKAFPAVRSWDGYLLVKFSDTG